MAWSDARPVQAAANSLRATMSRPSAKRHLPAPALRLGPRHLGLPQALPRRRSCWGAGRGGYSEGQKLFLLSHGDLGSLCDTLWSSGIVEVRRQTVGGKPDVRVRRVYDEPEPDDGTRVLVDRIWPRGLAKDKARLDQWFKQVAPSTELRKWYSHDPERFEEFGRRYREELKDAERAQAIKHLRKLARSGTLTLLTATKHAEISEAAVLANLIRG
jgi:uncharacterized protein YeaO (DUF488 family)